MARTTKATTAATFKPRVRRLGDRRYLVESRRRPGFGHRVDTLRGTCTCPAGRHNRRCWHLALAATFDAAYVAWMAQGATTPRPAGMAALVECFG